MNKLKRILITILTIAAIVGTVVLIANLGADNIILIVLGLIIAYHLAQPIICIILTVYVLLTIWFSWISGEDSKWDK